MVIAQWVWENLFGGLRQVFWYAFNHITGYGTQLLDGLIDIIGGYLPVGWLTPEQITNIKGYAAIVNAWVPVDVFITVHSGYMVAFIAAITIRHVIKMIPTLG